MCRFHERVRKAAAVHARCAFGNQQTEAYLQRFDELTAEHNEVAVWSP
jgi:hypothetical protein